ncbi:MAG: UbiA family prenyltransferase [Chloroflexi bacterium]|nr:UbiA family prenyltransferase [Chloroflexota bacterium]
MKSLMKRWIGGGGEVKVHYSRLERLGGLVDITRPRLALMTPLGAGAAVVLARGTFPPLSQCLWGFAAVALAVGGIHSFNDYIDRSRDRTAWPGRPIPSGRVRAREALFLTWACFLASVIITGVVFNGTALAILVLTLVLGSLYSLNLRRKIGYLILPPINGLIYLGGWAAGSPETLFSSWLPWGLFLLALFWQTGHIMIYSAIHPPAKDGDRVVTESPGLLTRTSLETAARIGFSFLALTLFLSVLLGVVIPLGPVYLVLVLAGGVMAIRDGLKFLKDTGNREKGFKAFGSASNFMLIIRGGILLAVLINVWLK